MFYITYSKNGDSVNVDVARELWKMEANGCVPTLVTCITINNFQHSVGKIDEAQNATNESFF